MKIKIKRYKEIEQIALAEALVKIIEEASLDNTKVQTLQNALKALNLKPEAVQQINAIIASQLGLTQNRPITTATPQVGAIPNV